MDEKSKYQKLTKEANALQEEYKTRKFSYDPEADAGYKEYARLVREDGKRAMEDTIGKASALTGGYGNSWAASAGQQVFGDFVRQAAEAQPAFRQQARQEFDAENQDILNRLGIINNQRAAMYADPTEEQKAYALRVYKQHGEDALNKYIDSLSGVDTDAIMAAVDDFESSFKVQEGKIVGKDVKNKTVSMDPDDWVKYMADPTNGYDMTEEQAEAFVERILKTYEE